MKYTGIALVAASACFWLAWCFMPGVGVTDTDTIFRLVAQHRSSVFVSVVLQLVSAAAYAPGVVGIVSASESRGSTATRIGAVLLAVGAMGSAADAIYHLVAYEMTAPNVPLSVLAPVMRRLQGPDLALLLPFVLAFFAAHIVLVVSRRGHDSAARAAFWVLMSLPIIVGGLLGLTKLGAISTREVGLGVLLTFNASLGLYGLSLEGAARRAGSVGAVVRPSISAMESSAGRSTS